MGRQFNNSELLRGNQQQQPRQHETLLLLLQLSGHCEVTAAQLLLLLRESEAAPLHLSPLLRLVPALTTTLQQTLLVLLL